MGCDIHLMVERRRQKPVLMVTKRDNQKIVRHLPIDNKWYNCEITSSGEWSDSVYGMFAKLADVRNIWNLEHIELRGFPEDASYETLQRYAYRVISDEQFKKWFPDETETIHSGHKVTFMCESEAQNYINDYGAKILKVKGQYNNDAKFVTEPENHSANWCTLSELEKCVNEIFFDEELKEYTGDCCEWLALVHYMKGLEIAGNETRCVFWFDN